MIDFRGHRPRRVLQQIDAARIERPFVHPHDLGAEPMSNFNIADRDHVAAADVDLVRESQRDRLPGMSLIEVTVPCDDALDAGLPPGRPYRDRVARADDAGEDLSGVTAKF